MQRTLEREVEYVISDTDFILVDGDREYPVKKVKDLPDAVKPRERLLEFGSEALSLHELLAVMLQVGTKKENVLLMSQRILKEYGEKGIILETNAEKLCAELNVPITKACQIVACFELGRRLFQQSPHGEVVLRTPQQVYDYVQELGSLPKEYLRGLYLNSRNRVIHDEVISIGTLTSNLIHPREVFQPAIAHGAAALILVHNHPSGSTKPSVSDVAVTKQLIEVGKIMGIDLLDHVIVTKHGFSSVPGPYVDLKQ